MRRRAWACWLLLLPASCARPGATAGVNADASVAGIRSDIRDLRAAVVQVNTELRAGRDVNTNDKWTLRLLGFGVLLLGLSYPVGKIVWLSAGAVQRRARRAGIGRPATPM